MRGALHYSRSPSAYNGPADYRSVSVRIPVDLWTRLDQLAERLDIPVAQAARRLLEVSLPDAQGLDPHVAYKPPGGHNAS